MKSNLKIEKDIFNSEIFKEEFGNIVEYSDDITKEQIKSAIRKTPFTFFGVKVNAKDLTAMYSFQKAGFYVVDCLVTFEFDKEKCSLPDLSLSLDFKKSLNVHEIENLAKVAKSAFKNDRFHSDPNIKTEYADDYYYQWVKNSFSGYSDGVLVPLFEGKIAGFITYKNNNIDSSTSTIVLNAVDPRFRGKGIYEAALLKCTKDLLDKSSKIHIGTQVDNIPVQRAWQKLGYKLIDAKFVLHFFKSKHW
ncbi:MAG: GNAT family N-acetyltransferase [Bacilli bacterium]|nr:GNAT family N-acetyltransferase [Bacilli bacterium]